PVSGRGTRERAPLNVVIGTALDERLGLTGLPQLERRILAHRLVQAVTRDAPHVLFDDQRFLDQRRQMVEVEFADAYYVLQREPAGEHAQPPKQGPLAGGQKVMAPCDGGLERLVP